MSLAENPVVGSAPGATPRVEHEALVTAGAGAVVGAVFGLAVEIAEPGLLFADGPTAFALWAAVGSGAAAAAAAGAAYPRSRSLPGQAWRRALPAWQLVVATFSVLLVHAVLAFIVVYVLYRLLGLGFIDLPVGPFWSVAMMAVTVGLTAQQTYRSVSIMTTQLMSSLLRTFIAFGTITAMIISPDPQWWRVHFSHLGTYHDSLSSLFFNGTLVVGGLLVTTLAVYVAHDMRLLVGLGVLRSRRAPRVTAALFIVMGAAFAGVGLVPVDIDRILHDVAALGLAAAFLGMLASGPWLLKGMPRPYFVYSWAIFGSVAVSGVMFGIGVFSLTAIEILVFVLIFAWMALFIRFLGVAGTAALSRA